MTEAPEISWVQGWAALEALAPEWQALASRTGAEIFLTPQWLAAWWPRLGRGRLLALVARQQGRLVGFLPFMISPWPGRVARFAGTDPNAMVLALPVEAPHQPTLLSRACTDLLGRFGARLVSFTPVSDRAAFLPDILSLPESLAVTRQPQGTHSLFDLPASFAEWQATQISNKRRGQIRRELTALRETFGLENHHFPPTEADFDAFVAFHNRQWQAVGKGGHFTDWPGVQSVYRALIPQGRPDSGLHFFGQTGHDGPLATQMCLISGNTCHWRLPARTLDPQAEKLSIGKIGLILMIEDLIALGVTRIEGGRGVYDYKTQHGGQDVPVNRLVVSRATPGARAALRLALAWSEALDLIYYRLWFKKLAPRLRQRLGLPARPLWAAWIRSRL